jgi:hypothetical protein
MWKHDQAGFKLTKVEPDIKGQQILLTTIKNSYGQFKDMMLHTRARSKSYPYVDQQALAACIADMGIPAFTNRELTQMMIESLPQPAASKEGAAASDPVIEIAQMNNEAPKILRPAFIECLCRIAAKHFNMTSPGQAFTAVKALIKGPFVHFRDKVFKGQLNYYHNKREAEMWSEVVAGEFSLQEQSLKKVFAKYDHVSDSKLGSVSLQEWNIFIKDLSIDFSENAARQCFAESNYACMNENDPVLVDQLNRITFLEMLDATIRLAVMLFDESEWNEYSTRKKVWYLLDSILHTIDEKRIYPDAIDKIAISDSEESNDDDDEVAVQVVAAPTAADEGAPKDKEDKEKEPEAASAEGDSVAVAPAEAA